MSSTEQEIVTVLAEFIPDRGIALAQRAGPQALAYAHAITGEIALRLEAQTAYALLWHQFEAQPQVLAPVLTGMVQVLMQTDPTLSACLEALLLEFRQAQQAHTPGTHEIHTVTVSGERNVAIGGDASGNTFNMGDHTKIGEGSFTGHDRFTVRGNDNIIGNENTLTVDKSTRTDAVVLAQAFGELYARIQQDTRLTPAQQTTARQEVAEIQQAAMAQGDKIAESFIRERLCNLQHMAPDILDVVLATFASPVAGVGMVIKKIAQKMKEETNERK